MTKVAIDTNILIYLIDNSDSRKHALCKELVVEAPKISSQVVSEFLNVTKRLIKAPKDEVLGKCIEWLTFVSIEPVDLNTLKKANLLINKYDFQLFDSIIVASALDSGCEILYSEDMHNGLFVENQLKIENPFL